MTKLWPIVIFSCLMAVLSHGRSKIDFRLGVYAYKEKICYCIMAVAMILFCGLRTRCNDTGAYIHAYELMRLGGTSWQDIDWQIGSNPGFKACNLLLVQAGASAQTFLLFYAAITVGIYLWFIRKYTNNIWLSVFFVITMGVYGFTLAAIKQCVAVAFCLIATDRMLNKKWIPFVLWILIASTFHPYALMYFVAPLLTFTPWSKKTYIMLAAFAVAGFALQPLLGTVINVTSMFGEEYTEATFSGDGVNPFRLAVCSVPLILSYIVRSELADRDDRNENLMINMSVLNGEIMFVALFGTANYFARLANYFLIFQAISMTWLLAHFGRDSKKIITIAAVMGYLAYFYYAAAIDQPFDLKYSSVTLMEYLKSLF